MRANAVRSDSFRTCKVSGDSASMRRSINIATLRELATVRKASPHGMFDHWEVIGNSSARSNNAPVCHDTSSAMTSDATVSATQHAAIRNLFIDFIAFVMVNGDKQVFGGHYSIFADSLADATLAFR
jgi:hypothetical protein